MRTFDKTTLMLGTLLSSALLVSVPAHAQVTLGEDGEVANEVIDDEIVVTGSRIVNANIVSSSPVTTLDEGLFERTGVSDVSDLLNTLPSVTPAQDNNVSNGANGTSTLNLRGLGTTRNLVLIDGKRLGPGRSNIASADINQVPQPLLDRVEIVTGGASAVYGSDAIAGVTNFILRRDFNGVELNAQYGVFVDDNDNEFSQTVTDLTSTDGITPTSTQVDGESLDLSAVFGTDFADGRGNVAAYARYVDQGAVLQGTRDISRCAIVPLGATAEDTICVGSNFGPFPSTVTLPVILERNGAGDLIQFLSDGMGMFVDAAGNVVPAADAVVAPAGFMGSTQPRQLLGSTAGVVSLTSAGLIPRNADGSIITGSSNAFNFNPTNFFLRPTKRYQAGFLANYELNDNAEIYLDGLFFRNTTDAQIAPSATFGEVQQVNCDNPFLSAELVDLICTSRGFGPTDLASVQINRRFVEAGGRNTSIELDNLRFVGGIRGDLGANFQYDVFGQYAETSNTDVNTNDANIQLLNEALLVGPDGQCTSGRDGCLPLNLFGTGPVDTEALAAVLTPTLRTGEVTQTVVGGTVQGDLTAFQSPFASSSAAILVGAEYRKDKLQTQPDSILSVGGATGLGGPQNPTDAISEVYEVFAELGVALVEDAAFAEDISFTGQFRYSDYDYENNLPGGINPDGTSSEAYSAGLSWTPVSDIRLRGQYQRAVRAPNVFELFTPPTLALFNSSDPCSGAIGSENLTATREQCERTGLDPALFGLVGEDAGQLQQLVGGNIDLEPEQSDTITLGAVLRPRAIDGLSLSVDYFDISVDDFIAAVPPTATLQGCLDGSQPDFCAQINRDALGTLQIDGFVTATSQNIAERVVKGFDFLASYDLPFENLLFGLGGARLDYNGTLYTALEQTSFPGADVTDCLGFWGGDCNSFTGEVNPEYKHRLSLGWESAVGIDVTATWRYIGSVESQGDQVPEGTVGNEIGDENFFDIFAQYDALETLELGLGINNVFDNDPPVADFRFTANGNTFPSTYDSIGRYVFLTAKVKL